MRKYSHASSNFCSTVLSRGIFLLLWYFDISPTFKTAFLWENTMLETFFSSFHPYSWMLQRERENAAPPPPINLRTEWRKKVVFGRSKKEEKRKNHFYRILFTFFFPDHDLRSSSSMGWALYPSRRKQSVRDAYIVVNAYFFRTVRNTDAPRNCFCPAMGGRGIFFSKKNFDLQKYRNRAENTLFSRSIVVAGATSADFSLQLPRRRLISLSAFFSSPSFFWELTLSLRRSKKKDSAF